MTKQHLKDLIKRLVGENSGGIKFTHLVAEIATDRRTIAVDPDEIERVVRSMSDEHIHVLDYHWAMSKDSFREKMFVYYKKG